MRSVAAAILALLSSACASAPPPVCGSTADVSCEVDPRWKRQLAEPTALTVISARGVTEAQPPTVTFGGAAAGKTALYLRFPELELEGDAVERAYLRLEPERTGSYDPKPVVVEVWRVRAPWQSGGFDWHSQPPLGPPRAAARAEGRAPLRVDVTDLVREAQQNPSRSHGLAVLASAGDGQGVTFATGLGGAWLPRLEVYVR